MKKHLTIKMSEATYPMISRQDIPYLQYKWVPYGTDNLYPNFLTDLMYKSPTHNAIQTGKHELAVGDGLTWDENNEALGDIAIVNKLFYQANSDGETLDQVFNKAMLDEILYGGHSLQVIWSRDRQTIAEVYHVPFETVRKGKPSELGQINSYFVSQDWMNWRRKYNTPKELITFSTKDRSNPVQMIYSQQYFPTEIYPNPTYVASVPYILTDYEIGRHHLNAIKNGLATNFILNISSGIPSEEEQDDFSDDVKTNLTGSAAQKILVTFSEGKDNAPEFTPIQIQDEHQKFITLNEAVLQNLLTANRLTSPMLLGIKTPGQLGGGNEFEQAFDVYYNQTIGKLQNRVLHTFNKILKINGAQQIKFSVIKPQLISTKIGEAITSRVMTINELRKEIGLEELETGNTLFA
jgi:capsid portal protein